MKEQRKKSTTFKFFSMLLSLIRSVKCPTNGPFYVKDGGYCTFISQKYPSLTVEPLYERYMLLNELNIVNYEVDKPAEDFQL